MPNVSHAHSAGTPISRALALVGGVLRWAWAKPAAPIRARMPFPRWVQLHLVGTVVLMACGVVFFWPMLMRLDSYIMGGDSLFNAWTLGRLHYCLIGQGCTNLVDGNIFFPNHYSMMYSETQLSSGVLTLPLFWLNPNPIFSYNVWTIIEYVLSSWFMYFLAMHVSRNIRWVSVAAGLVFGYAPIKMSALLHMQNLSIFYLPLAVLFIAKYLRSRHWRFLVYLLVTLVLFFYASWYQMVFGLILIGLFFIGAAVFRLGRIRSLLWIGAAVVLAVVSTLPLASQYLAFSKTMGAKYAVSEQAIYATRLADYVLPYENTVLGWFTKTWFPALKVNGYNPDSSSYHGIVLCVLGLAAFVLACVVRRRSPALRRIRRWVWIFGVIAVVGFLASLGPYLQIRSAFFMLDGHKVPMPWLLVDKFLPQLSFIRSIGRASIMMLFALCVLLAALAGMLRARVRRRQGRRRWPRVILPACALLGLCLETLPLGVVPMSPSSYMYNLSVPAVYQRIHKDPQIDDIVVIYADPEYPGANTFIAMIEPVMWAGYHNKNIFNGYSGYFPPNYDREMSEFNHWIDDPVGRMRALGLRYVLVDLGLSHSRLDLAKVVEQSGLIPVYQDKRYVLLKLP